MFHSIKIGTDLSALENWVDTWADWGLIPSAKPTVSMAPANIKWQEIPGRSEPIDMTELVTDKVTYKNRTGSWSFIIIDNGTTVIPGATTTLHLDTYKHGDEKAENQNKSKIDSTPWNRKFDFSKLYRAVEVRYREIANFLHGKKYKCILEDEPDYYYEGRFQVGNLGSSRSNSTLTINYDLLPMKKHVLGNTAWGPAGPWDLISLENQIIPTSSDGVHYSQDSNKNTWETWHELKENHRNQPESL